MNGLSLYRFSPYVQYRFPISIHAALHIQTSKWKEKENTWFAKKKYIGLAEKGEWKKGFIGFSFTLEYLACI